jgi:hypothetical protein
VIAATFFLLRLRLRQRAQKSGQYAHGSAVAGKIVAYLFSGPVKTKTMADDKNKKDFRDRNKIAADEMYEVDYVAREHGVSRQQVLDAINAVGNDRQQVAQYLNDNNK